MREITALLNELTCTIIVSTLSGENLSLYLDRECAKPSSMAAISLSGTPNNITILNFVLNPYKKEIICPFVAWTDRILLYMVLHDPEKHDNYLVEGYHIKRNRP